MIKPLTRHDERVEFLVALAALLGCNLSLDTSLPDGCRPDVLRLDTHRHLLFFGDGKDTESPGCTATQARLYHYLLWMRSFVRDRDRIAIFAICFGDSGATQWVEVLCALAAEAGLSLSASGTTDFAPGRIVAWAIA
jgi:hypothetical protein